MLTFNQNQILAIFCHFHTLTAEWGKLWSAGDKVSHTFIIKRKHVELEAAGLFADIAMNPLCSSLVNSDGVLQRLHTWLQAEWLLGVTHRVPEEKCHKHTTGFFQHRRGKHFFIDSRCIPKSDAEVNAVILQTEWIINKHTILAKGRVVVNENMFFCFVFFLGGGLLFLLFNFQYIAGRKCTSWH